MSRLKIIAISGKQGSGKTTLASALAHTLGASVIKFASPLYQMHDAVCDVARNYGLEPASKEGKLLQFIGTEWGRDRFGEDVWADCLRQQLAETIAAIVVVDDMRFPNELAMLRDLGATTVRLECSEEVRSTRTHGWRGGDGLVHISETALDYVGDWDHVFETEGEKNVEDMVLTLKEIER